MYEQWFYFVEGQYKCFILINVLLLLDVRVRQNDEGVVETHWKGAAEIILGLCTRFVDGRGEVQGMTPEKVLHIFRLGLTKRNMILQNFLFLRGVVLLFFWSFRIDLAECQALT